MNLLTERKLRDVLALRRIGEATLLRDSDKVSELMNFHRRSDTPLGPPVCLRLTDRLGAERAIQRQNRPIPKQHRLGKTAVGRGTGLQPNYSGHFALDAACVPFPAKDYSRLAQSRRQTARTERRGYKVLDEILGLTFQRLRTQMKSRTPRPGSRGLSTPVILSQTELTAGRTVSHGKAEVGFASS